MIDILWYYYPVGLVASGGADNMVRLLDVGSREVSAILSNHTNNVCCLAHYGNSRLISGSWDSTAAVWNPQTGKLLYALTGHSNAVWCALAIAEDTFITGMIPPYYLVSSLLYRLG